MSASHPRVQVADYDPLWPQLFETLRQRIWPAVHDIAVSVEHVGSTSVPGLAAKPIVDVDVIVASRDLIPATIERLGTLGYVHEGNLGIEDREAFRSPQELPAHHLYLCPQDSAALANHLALRDSLRRNPLAVAQYRRIKKELAVRFPTDVERYTAGKTDFILAMLRSAGFQESVLRTIGDANRPSPNR